MSDTLWRRRFGANRAVIGRRTRLDGESYNIIGVMPPGFDFPDSSVQPWTPVWWTLPVRAKQYHWNHRFNVIARLNPGRSVEQARTELDGIARRIKQQFPGVSTGEGANVALLRDRMVSKVRPMLLVLMGDVACVLPYCVRQCD